MHQLTWRTKSISILLLGFGITVEAQNVSRPAAPHPSQPPQVAELISALPQCSKLRSQLADGQHGNGIELPYMRMMLQNGVKRAEVEVSSVLKKKKPTNMTIISRTYFSQYDGPNSQITDPTALDAIDASGLPTTLDGIAQARVLAAPIVHEIDTDIFHMWFHLGGVPRKRSSIVEFFASPWLQEASVLLFPRSWLTGSSSVKTLDFAATAEDTISVSKFLSTYHFNKHQLDQALFLAAMSRYDNTAVIDILVRAGADPNFRNSGGFTPLMAAISCPCNIQPLLAVGAQAGARNKSGLTALDIARTQKAPETIRLLEAATNKPGSGKSK